MPLDGQPVLGSGYTPIREFFRFVGDRLVFPFFLLGTKILIKCFPVIMVFFLDLLSNTTYFPDNGICHDSSSSKSSSGVQIMGVTMPLL